MPDAPTRQTFAEHWIAIATSAIEGYDRLWDTLHEIYPSPMAAVVAMRMAQEHSSLRWQQIDERFGGDRLGPFIDLLAELAYKIGTERPMDGALQDISVIARAHSVSHFVVTAIDNGDVTIKAGAESAGSMGAVRATFAMAKLVLDNATNLSPKIRAHFETFCREDEAAQASVVLS